ncbi:hypothetical protein SAMN02744124_02836 [Paenibacillus barengoltzii J12]|uniref:Uncharacterized protein n=3 Tax=Paenibacillus TaxID=44249 RepID=R9LKQ4_9BACL|nr:hypothetical protein C812_02378 [Paenibacillus barengoltzii G22]SMF39825.1 hypothetical protein SAMN02744124_02836 [Paenibacillus barengoltzii J12]
MKRTRAACHWTRFLLNQCPSPSSADNIFQRKPAVPLNLAPGSAAKSVAMTRFLRGFPFVAGFLKIMLSLLYYTGSKIRLGGFEKGMWTVMYIAPTAKVADMIKTKLTEEGFLVQTRPVNLSKQQYEILVPSGELEEVQEVLNSILHP